MAKEEKTKTQRFLEALEFLSGEFTPADVEELVPDSGTPTAVTLGYLERRGDLRRVRTGVYRKSSEFREILVNRFDYDEFVFFDGKRYWADGEANAKLGQCHALDGCGYDTDHVFDEIPRADFDAAVRALRVVEDSVSPLRPFIEAVDRCSTAVYGAKDAGLLLVHSRSEPLAKAVLDFCDCSIKSWGGPDLFWTFLYLDTHFPISRHPA